MSLAEHLKAKASIDLGKIESCRVALLVHSKGYNSNRAGAYVPDKTSPLVWRVFDEDEWNCEGKVKLVVGDFKDDVMQTCVEDAYRWYHAGYASGKKDGEWSGAYDKEREFSNAIGLLRKFGIGTVLMSKADTEDA